MQLEPIVAFTPGWANGNRGPWTYPSDPARFGSFFATALKRYPDVRMVARSLSANPRRPRQ